MKQLERRCFHGSQVRSKNGDKPGIEGVGAVYNQVYDNGWFKERIMPGAFNSVLASDPDIRCLFNHAPDNLLGRTKSKTMRVSDSPAGLQYDCDLPDTSLGRDVGVLVDRGDLDGCSFSFSVSKQTWREEKNAAGGFDQFRDIEEFDEVGDIGPVTYPAYTGTSVGSRSLWPGGIPSEIRSHVPELRRLTHTKAVDGENLTSDGFLIVGDPEKTDTWELPWKFSTEEKTKSHLRDALARFNQMKGVSAGEKKEAWTKLVKLCKEHDIDVGDEDEPRRSRPVGEARAEGDECSCACDACQDGNCADCDCDGDCDADNCGSDDCACGDDLRMRARGIEVTL